MHTHSNRVGIAAASAALIAIPMLTLPASPASAAVSLPTEVFPHNIIVFPQRDFVSLSGYSGQAGQTATFVVSRNGVTIGTASGVIGAGDPSLEVNHPGGVCWDAPSTPDILPGDEVQVYVGDQAAGGTAEGVRTRNVTDQQAVEVGTDVIVHGNATDLVTGGRVPLADLEQRIVNPDLVPFVGKRDIRATDISYDPVDPAANPNGTNFTAAYHGLSQGARNAAVAGEARVLSWEFVDADGNRQGITIYEAGVTGGPGMGGCPAASSYSVTSSGPKNLNVSTNAGALGLSGVSFDALGVRVSLDDTDPATAPVLWPPADQPAATPTPGSGRQTWSVSIPASSHNTLSDGTLTATGIYTVPNGTDPSGAPITADIGGASLTLLKDLVAPATPSASPPGGTYFSSQQVTLNAVDQADTVRYRIGATGTVPDPTVLSAVAPAQIGVTSTQTIKAAAFDAAGNRSPVLTSVYVISSATAPAAPTGVGAIAGNASATVSWTAPADGGSPIVDYTVQTLTAGTAVAPVTVTGPSTTINGLANGTSYSFKVTARNAAGSGPASATSNIVTPATTPGSPSIGSATADDRSAVVHWLPPADNGGSPLTGYQVQTFRGASRVGTLDVADASATQATVSGLTNGTSYTFKVLARNSAGLGAPSAASNAVTPVAAPAAPAIGTASRGDSSAIVRWAAPTNGGSAITSYQVQTFSGPTLLGTLEVANPAARQATVTGLTNGTSYTFRVLARNAVGLSAASAESNPVTPATRPGAPAIGTAVAGDTSAVVSWTAPTTDGGSPVTGYQVTAFQGATRVSTVDVTDATATQATVSGLTNGTSYTFRVWARNAVGLSLASAASNPVIPRTVPGAPTIGTASAGNASAIVRWAAPAGNGGSPITGYQVQTFSGPTLVKTLELAQPAATQATVTGLTNGTSYTFRVLARNAAGLSVASAASNPVTPTTAPSAPSIGTAVAGVTTDTAVSATAKWTAPVNTGGSPITSYLVTAVRSNGTTVAKQTTNVTALKFTGLVSGASYRFKVQATNAVGTSAASALSNSVVAR